MRQSLRKLLLGTIAISCGAAGCKTSSYSSGLRDGVAVAPQLIDVGTPFHPVSAATVELGNKEAFEAKLAAIEGATTRIDMAYFIWTFDQTSARLEEALLAKAAAGVKIRLLVDGVMALPHLEMMEMLVAEGRGNIEITLFRPVPEEVWEDLASWGFADRAAFGDAASGFSMGKVKDLLLSNERLAAIPGLRSVLALLAPSDDDARALLPTLQALPGLNGGDGVAAFSPEGVFRAAGEAMATEGMTFRPGAWSMLLKRLHHKLLVVDARYVQGGGRNIENAYHWDSDFRPLRPASDKYVFMDADFFVDSPAVATAALTSFDAYWRCLSDYQGCTPKVRTVSVTPVPGKDYAAMRARIRGMSDAYVEASVNFVREEGRATHLAQHGTFSAPDLNVAYVENRMFPRFRGAEATFLGQEQSQYNKAWARLIEGVRPGGSIVIQNAYLYFPTELQVALSRAVKNCAKLTIITNSESSSEQGFISTIALPQYAYFLKIGREAARTCADSDQEAANNVTVYEYQTSDESLHAKIAVVGDYVVVGSNNADPRSAYTDTQNGVIIGPGPHGNPLARDLNQWFLDRLSFERSRPDGSTERLLAKVTEAEVQAKIPSFADVTNPETVRGLSPTAVLLGYLGRLSELAYESEDRQSFALRGVLSLLFIGI